MRILLATDGSAGAARAEGFLRALPISSADEVLIVAAADSQDVGAGDHLSWCRWRFWEGGVRARTVIRVGHPAEVIDAIAVERACDLIVTGSRGRGEWAGALLGSVARALARHAAVPLLVVRSRRTAPRAIVLAIDGSDEASAAIEMLGRLPLPVATKITVARVHAERDPRREDAAIARARAVLGERISGYDVVAAAGVSEWLAQVVSDAAADLIVLGTADQTKPAGPLPFSLVDHVLAHAHCAVLVAKPRLAARHVGVTSALSVATP